jgi:hypothetical protein
MTGQASLTAAELAVLHSIWPAGSHHPGAAADVFTAVGRHGTWLLVAKRSDGGYVLVEDSGGRSTIAGSLAALGLPDRPISGRSRQ